MRMLRGGLAALMLCQVGWAQTIQVSKDNRTIAITATDSAEALADTANVSVGYVVYGGDHDQTYADASRISNEITNALADDGVKPDQIESGELDISPVDPGDKQRYGTGARFVVRQSWRVTVKAASAAEVLHLAVTHGANNGGGITWSLADESSLEAQAAEKALTHAKQIAERMANGLHATLGPLVYASNTVERGEARAYAPAPMMMARGKVAVKPLAVSPDKVSRSATVYAVFAVQ